MLFVDIKFAKLLSNQLQKWNLKQERPFIAQFRCPICGDSQKHKSKARGFFYEDKNELWFKCHNCNAAHKFKTFLKIIDDVLFDEYLLETVNPHRDDVVRKNARELENDVTKIVTPHYLKSGPLKALKKISQLPWDHYAKKNVEGRMIPNRFHKLLFFCPNFFEWTNSIIPHKFKHVGESNFKDEPRLIIPFINGKGMFFAYQGRSFDPNVEDKYRYYTIVINRDEPRIYGFDRVDFSKPLYVVEGPIDSMFIDNCVAMAGSATAYEFYKGRTTFIFDNEPRNPEIVKLMTRKIRQGHKVCIQTSNVDKKRDINDMAIAGMDSNAIKNYIDKHTYTGLMAETKLTEWRKC